MRKELVWDSSSKIANVHKREKAAMVPPPQTPQKVEPRAVEAEETPPPVAAKKTPEEAAAALLAGLETRKGMVSVCYIQPGGKHKK